MILCIDIGNSTVFMGMMHEGKVLTRVRVPSSLTSYDEHIAGFIGENKVDTVLMSSVVPAATILAAMMALPA